MTFAQADGMKPNPYYGKRGLYGYEDNCQTCVVAFERSKKMITDKQVLKYAKTRGYDKVTKCDKTWDGYSIYEPGFNRKGSPKIGYPLVILVKDDEIRISTEDESLEILDYLFPDTEEDEED